MHYVVKTKDGWLGTRKNTGSMYVSRTSESKTLSEARVFNTKTAAKNSANAAKFINYEVLGFEISIAQLEKTS